MNIRHCLPKCIAITAVVVLAATSSCFGGSVLSVPQYNQEKDQWCWNASSQMILAFCGYSYSQTEIANWAVGGQNIPNYLFNSSDPNMHGCDEILSHFGSISSSGLDYAMSLSTLANEMDNSRPVMIAWAWDSGGGHAVVLCGTHDDTVHVNDPWPDHGQSVNTYDWVCRPYGEGTWTQTLKLNDSSDNTYYQYLYYYGLFQQSYSQYQATGSYYDLASAYYYYAYAAYYYYTYYGDSSSANAYYNYYKNYAQYYYELYQNQQAYYQSYLTYYSYASYYYSYYQQTGSYLALAYTYYYYAYAMYYYYTYYGDSSSANDYYDYYMYLAYDVYDNYC